MSKNHLIPTETLNKRTQNLGTSSPKQIAQMINAEDFNAARAVKKAAISIGKTIQLASETFLAGGKIIFIGAGTSGRLGVLEAAECVPTFGTKPSQIVGIIAGGKKAMFRSQEGALQQAKQLGASTVLMACNKKADTSFADIFIFLDTGAEALNGSTRMKAGTATKMTLNAISTGAMARAGKVYGNLMVDVQPTNQKLIRRAVRLIASVTKTDEKTAEKLLIASGKSVKTAIVMQMKKINKGQAEKLLQKHHGFLEGVLHEK